VGNGRWRGWNALCGNRINSVQAWNGTAWSKVGGGDFNQPVANVVVNKATGYVYAVWRLQHDAWRSMRPAKVAYWNGSAWAGLGTGISGGTVAQSAIAGTVVDATFSLDGSILYVAGYFTTAGGIASAGIAKWNGTAWENIGGGVAGFYRSRDEASQQRLNGDIILNGSHTRASVALVRKPNFASILRLRICKHGSWT
jgi:hypothetical protein